jgi:hypothetical protein
MQQDAEMQYYCRIKFKCLFLNPVSVYHLSIISLDILDLFTPVSL